MAADLQITVSGTQKTKCKTKVFKFAGNEEFFPEPFMIGFAGDAGEIIDVVDFYEHPELYPKPPRLRNTQGLVLSESGKIFQFTSVTNWILIDAKFASIGSGSSFALGAMQVGASPKQAVEAASKIDPFTGMGIKTYKF